MPQMDVFRFFDASLLETVGGHDAGVLARVAVRQLRTRCRCRYVRAWIQYQEGLLEGSR